MSNEERFVAASSEYKFGDSNIDSDFEELARSRIFEDVSEGMKKYMPIGSIVELYDDDAPLMVMGFNYNNDDTIYDYIGCLYPFGVSKDTLPKLFNHDQINKVFHVGFINNRERAFKSELNQNNSNLMKR